MIFIHLLFASDGVEDSQDVLQVGIDECVSFSIGDFHILVDISQIEQVVQDEVSVAEVNTDDVTQDSDSASEFSWGNLVVLVVVESEEDGTEDVGEANISQQGLDLSDGGRQGLEVTVEEAVVVVDESQVHGDQEGEFSQIDGVGVAGEISELESSIEEFSTDLLSNEEVDEAAVGSAELSQGKLAVSVNVSLVPEVDDNLVLVVLTLDDVLEVLLSNDSSSLSSKEVLYVDTKSVKSGC